MPTLTRESRSVLALVLAVVLLPGGPSSLGLQLYAALRPGVPGDPFWAGVVISLVMVAVSVGILLLARSATGPEGPRDVWHHLAVAATWLAALLVLLSVLTALAAMQSNWPFVG